MTIHTRHRANTFQYQNLQPRGHLLEPLRAEEPRAEAALTLQPYCRASLLRLSSWVSSLSSSTTSPSLSRALPRGCSLPRGRNSITLSSSSSDSSESERPLGNTNTCLPGKVCTEAGAWKGRVRLSCSLISYTGSTWNKTQTLSVSSSPAVSNSYHERFRESTKLPPVNTHIHKGKSKVSF